MPKCCKESALLIEKLLSKEGAELTICGNRALLSGTNVLGGNSKIEYRPDYGELFQVFYGDSLLQCLTKASNQNANQGA